MSFIQLFQSKYMYWHVMIDFTNFFEIFINDYWIKNFIIIIYLFDIENFRKLDDIRLVDDRMFTKFPFAMLLAMNENH